MYKFDKKVQMQGVGNQVIAALSLMFLPIVVLIVYYWTNIKQFYLRQLANREVPLQQPHDRQQVRRQRNDTTCSICLTDPKQMEISSTCGHSFCARCIFQLYDHNPIAKVKCPLCRNDMSVLFKCFHQELPSQQGIEISTKIRNYNLIFDDNRPLIRRILEFPYIFKRLLRFIFSMNFLVFFLRNIYFIRLIFLVFFYLILPFDILPESVMGVIGFIDDVFIFVILKSYIATIVAVQYYRAQHH